MVSQGRVQIIHGRETVMRCKTCAGEDWKVIGEVRGENKDKPLEVKAYAMRMICCRCENWIYLDDVTRPQTPTITPKRHYIGARAHGTR